MKNIFVHDSIPNQEFSKEEKMQIKQDFISSRADVNSKRIYLYLSIIAIFELFLVIFDAIKKDATYSAVQWMYTILNSTMAFLSVIMIAITSVYNRKKEKPYKLLTISLGIYSVLILICGISDAIIGTISSGRENLTMFFICLMLVSCVFYVNPWVIFTSSTLIFIGFELFTHLTTFSSHHTYAPYPIFIVFITASASFIRFAQMKVNIKQSFTIKKLQKQAEHENELKSQFLANMSHEIRTPMNAIVGMSELAMDFDLDDSQKNLIRQIRTSGISLVGIINDILDFSKIESGKMEIVSVDYDLMKLMNDIANVVLVRLKDKDVELRLEIDPSLPSVFHGDDMRIRQILINLAGNATKFTESGFIALRVENLQNYEKKDGLKISVIDSGVGIRQEDLQKLFNAFQQVDMKMNRTKGGTGLGLAISKNLMTLMGGTIGVTSEYGKGSCFYINLPQKIVDTTAVNQKYKMLFDSVSYSDSDFAIIPVVNVLNQSKFASLFAEKAVSATFTAPNAKILVVDDNEVNLQVADGLLKKFAVNAKLVKSGFEALDEIKNGYDIIFMDHQMPVMDGIETVSKIRASENDDAKNDIGSHQIVIALSANAVNGAKEMFLENGFDDFLAKPVQGKDFASALLKWLPEEKIATENTAPEKAALKVAASENTVPENAVRTTAVPESRLPKVAVSENDIPEGFSIPDTSKINFYNAVENAGGFENWLLATKTFYNLINKNADDIHFSLACLDWKNYTILVHALKSSSKIIGADEISKKSAELESLGNQMQELTKNDENNATNTENSSSPENLSQKTDEISQKTENLLKEYKSLSQILEKSCKFGETPDEEKQELQAGEFDFIKDQILLACDACDLDSIENLYKTLETKKLDDQLSEKVKKLKEAIDNIDFSTISTILL